MNCHATAPYMGMIASSNTAAGDSRPNTTLDSKHPATGDCGNCHTTAPTFALDVTAGKPSNPIPTSKPCVQCQTTTADYKQYSSPGTHPRVTGCLSCYGSAPDGTLS